MKKILLLLLSIVPVLASAQLRFSGKVMDESGQPIDGATITLKRNEQGVSSALADLGNFSLNYPEGGTYTLFAGIVGYKPLQLHVTLPKDSILLIMQADSKKLKEVSVTYRKPLIEPKIDRVIFNVENSTVASGGSAWEALAKAPGVQINSGDQITAGRKNVQVYLDGKPLNLSGEDLSAYLQGLPADLVSQVEVFSNPPAKFEAQGASVINIVTKKANRDGLNGSVNSGFTQATYGTYNGSGTFNYRQDKLNVYGSYGFTQRHGFQDHDVDIDYGDSFWNSPNRTISQSNNHNYRLGADYQVSANQVLGFLVTGSNRAGNSRAHAGTQVWSKQMVLDSTLITDNYAGNTGSGYTYNLNYNIKLDSGKRSFNIDVDYAPYSSTSNASADNVTYLSDGTERPNQFHIYTPSSQDIKIYSGKADYTYVLFGNWAASSGLKYSSTQSLNNFDYYNRVASSLEAVLPNSNHFNYKEKTAAAYTSISRDLGRWNLQAGLRGEYTSTNGYSVTLNSTNKRNYFKLFPTLYIQYKADDNNRLQFTYAYRIERPEYNRLNPAKRFSSPYNIYVGNPALQPTFVRNFELSYTYKQDYNITGYYTNIHDQFSNINIQDNTNKIYYGTHANLGQSILAGIRFSATVRPSDWWNIDLLGDAIWQQEKSVYLDGSYNYKIYSYEATLKQAFTIDAKAGLKAELSGSLIGPGIQGIYKVNHNSQVDAGLKTNVLKGNGTLRLAVNDIFNTNYYLIHINYLDQHSTSLHHSESRNASLSFSYRFGKNVAASRSRNTASEDEKNRAK